MDLASLRAEIERKRKNVESMNVLLPERKCFRRGDLEAKHEEAYWKNYYLKSDDNSSKASSSIDDTNEKATALNEKFQLSSRTDVIKKLRERNQPIRLFGESDLDSYRRLRLLETTEPELKGQRNDFKVAMDKIDREYLALILHANNPSRSEETNTDDKDDETEVGPPIPNQPEEVKEDSGYDLPDIIEQIKTTRKGNRAYDCQVVLNYFKFILKKWSQELTLRELDEKKNCTRKN